MTGQSVAEHRMAGRGPLHLGVLTVSDTRTRDTDTSGALIIALAEEAGHRVVDREIVPDEPDVADERSSIRGFHARDELHENSRADHGRDFGHRARAIRRSKRFRRC